MASNAKDIQLRELKDTVSQLKTMISEQTELIRSLRLIIEEKSSHEKALQEQVDYLTKKLFGSSSERRSDDIPGQQNLFDEAEVEQDPSLLEEETVIKEHTRKKKATHEDLFKGLKVEKVVIPLPEEDQICPVCGTQMVLIGEEYVRRELEFIPATCKVIEYYSQSYGCPFCKEGLGDTEKPVIIKSQVPAALVGKGPASASTVAWTMYQKYANGLPLYRQEKDWKQYGAQISRTTLANWIIYCSQNYFQPMYDYFHRELLKRSFAMADETRVQVLKEEGRQAQTQSFMWLFRSGEDGLPAIILYGYSPTRSGSHAREFLEGYRGYLETDGYQGYNNLPGIRRCSCWAHIRRYFIDAVPKENSMTTASRQCRESSTAADYSPLRTPLTKSIPVIMKRGSSCVSRRKNLFWRLFGRGSISRIQSGTPGWIKRLIMFSTGVIRQRPIWKTGGAALPIISARMQFVHSQ